MPSWVAVIGWRVPRPRLDWEASTQWARTFEPLISAATERLTHSVERWDERLAQLGGDPSREDWSTFRPLRLSREEDWSDWLAHLLERSTSGRFAARFFAGDETQSTRWKVARAEREVSADTYRADLVVRFHDSTWTHVEVKVGDLALDKTADTGQALRRHSSQAARRDVLLLPLQHRPIWESRVQALGESSKQIDVRTWHDVARALRRSLGDETEQISWRIWAAAFLGAIEQTLLGFPPVPRERAVASHRSSARDLARLNFLEEMEER